MDARAHDSLTHFTVCDTHTHTHTLNHKRAQELAKEEGKEFALRAPLRDVLLAGGSAAGGSAVRSLGRLGGTFDCPALNAALGEVKDSVCCGF